MKFYNLKTRSHVDVPESDVQKKKMTRKTKNGTQVRYAFVANHKGEQLFKFCSEADYKNTNVKEIS